jgi:coenzyme F420-reducing hydrogenase alpha subunit
MYAGMVDRKGNLQLYDGDLRFRSATGEIVEDHIPADDYAQWIGESSTHPEGLLR